MCKGQTGNGLECTTVTLTTDQILINANYERERCYAAPDISPPLMNCYDHLETFLFYIYPILTDLSSKEQ